MSIRVLILGTVLESAFTKPQSKANSHHGIRKHRMDHDDHGKHTAHAAYRDTGRKVAVCDVRA